MLIAMGCDNLACGLKEHLMKIVRELGHEVVDFGAKPEDPVDYPEVAQAVAKAVAAGKCERGILVCGTGIGMSICANKVQGIRAAVCHDLYSTERSILSNNAQILCMGELVIGRSSAAALVKRWLELKFVESPSSRKIAKIAQLEEGTLKDYVYDGE